MLPLPASLLEKRAVRGKQKIMEELAFLTEDHRKVHHFIVRDLPLHGKPMSPDHVAGGLNLPVEQVAAILQELEDHMTFLYRNEEGAVVWAYPVTVEETPHHLTFSTGEKIYAA
jgi:hypothetical protein